MRIFFVALLVLVTGCAGQGKTAQQRLAEIKTYRRHQEIEQQKKAAGPPAKAAVAPAPVAPPAGPGAPPAVVPSTPGAPAAQPSASAAATAATAGRPGAPTAPTTAAAAQERRGPRAGLTGFGVTLGGATAPAGRGIPVTSTLSLRGFVSDAVSLAGVAGAGIGVAGDDTELRLTLGGEVVAFFGDLGENMHAFFVGEVAYNRLSLSTSRDEEDPSTGGTAASDVSAVSLGAGGGLEYWLAPRLSVNARMMVGGVLGVEGGQGTFFGTFRPGLGVTLFAN
ncbi:hypothetical protein WME76_21710 [Sorangium sp. So ce119]|uniref:hypothetical protein n=1 Tax=Sorangium sp. So ce119 TaxID=3133279 RepID=UPI003F5F3E1F